MVTLNTIEISCFVIYTNSSILENQLEFDPPLVVFKVVFFFKKLNLLTLDILILIWNEELVLETKGPEFELLGEGSLGYNNIVDVKCDKRFWLIFTMDFYIIVFSFVLAWGKMNEDER